MAITWSVIETADRTGDSGATSTITGVPFGASAVDRHIAVFLTSLNGNGAISAVTIAGQTTYVAGTGNSNITTIAVAKIPAGMSSGDVVATLTGTDQLYSFGVMAIFGADATSGLYDSAQQDGPAACLIDLPEGGVILGSALAWQSGVGAWSNLAEVIAWDNVSYCAAAAYTGPAQTNRSVSYSTANGTSFLSLAPVAAQFADARGDLSGRSVVQATSESTTISRGQAHGSSAISGRSEARSRAAAVAQGVSISIAEGDALSVGRALAGGIAISGWVSLPYAPAEGMSVGLSMVAGRREGDAPTSAMLEIFARIDAPQALVAEILGDADLRATVAAERALQAIA